MYLNKPCRCQLGRGMRDEVAHKGARLLTSAHVFYIRGTSVQNTFGEPLQQSARSTRYTTTNRRRSLFGLLSRKVRRCWLESYNHYKCSVLRRSIEAAQSVSVQKVEYAFYPG